MKSQIISLLVTAIVIFGVLTINLEAKDIELDLMEDLDLEDLKEQWDKDDKVQFESQGINVTIVNKFRDIEIWVKETIGRDVKVSIKIPEHYISSSVLGYIKNDDGVIIEWRNLDNYTKVSFRLHAYQETVFTISKGDLILGGLKKSVHKWFSYVEYRGDADGDEENIIVFIPKQETDFEIDNKHMIVQYKTGFHNWYYPVSDTSSEDIYYYVDDLGDQYRVVTHFKGDESGDIKIHVFPGASEGAFNWDSFKGGVARSFISLQIGIKKAFIDWFGDMTPTAT